MHNFPPDLVKRSSGPWIIYYQVPFPVNMGIFFANEPRLRIPASAPPLARQPFQMPLIPDILGPESHKFSLWPYLDSVKIAAAAHSRLFSCPSFLFSS